MAGQRSKERDWQKKRQQAAQLKRRQQAAQLKAFRSGVAVKVDKAANNMWKEWKRGPGRSQ